MKKMRNSGAGALFLGPLPVCACAVRDGQYTSGFFCVRSCLFLAPKISGSLIGLDGSRGPNAAL